MKFTVERSVNIIAVLIVLTVAVWFVFAIYLEDNEELLNVSFIVAGIVVSLALLLILLVKRMVIGALGRVLQASQKIARGEHLEKPIKVHTSGVISKIAKQINDTYTNMRKATKFAQEIGEGNFETDEEYNEDDPLTSALLDMRDKLKNVAEEEQKRNWAIQGLANFSELLRNNANDVEELGFNIVKNLVKYLEANQGGFYILHTYDGDESLTEEEKMFKGKLELAACYAYERRKYKTDEIYVGEGLVGQCVVERQSIFITDVPEDYINITSGLGKATPKSILIVPLILNDEIYGVIELASFKVFKDYQIKFVEDLGESIASTLASVKMSMNTQKLLTSAEESNQVMKANEAQMEAMQHELSDKLKQIEEDSAKFQSIVEAINKTNAAIEFDLKGHIIDVNDMFLGVMGFKKEELMGEPETILLPPDEKGSPQHAMMWESIKSGQYFSGEFRRVNKAGKDIWMNGTYNPIFDLKGNPTKIIKFASFTTDEKERQLDLNGKLNALKETVGVIELDMELILRSVNPLVLNMLGYKRLEIRNKSLGLFLGEEFFNSRSFKNIWESIKDGDAISHTLMFLKKEGGEMYYKCNFSLMRNLVGIPVKVLMILTDVTKEVEHEKRLSMELEEALMKSNMIKVADEEKDTEGALVALNDALEELSKGDLSPTTLIESNKLPLLLFDENLNIYHATQIMQSLIGRDIAEVQGETIEEIIDFNEEQQQEFGVKVANNMVFQEKYHIKTSDGNKTMNLLFAPILGAENEESLTCMITISI